MTSEGQAEPDPHAAPGRADLRHDLLTPLNHIIGYGEMLQETVEELGRTDLSTGVRELLDLGKDASVLINRILPAGGAACAAADLAGVRAHLSAVLGRIAERCTLLRASAEGLADETLSQDLGRVRAATDLLADLVDRRLAGPEPGAGPPAG